MGKTLAILLMVILVCSFQKAKPIVIKDTGKKGGKRATPDKPLECVYGAMFWDGKYYYSCFEEDMWTKVNEADIYPEDRKATIRENSVEWMRQYR